MVRLCPRGECAKPGRPLRSDTTFTIIRQRRALTLTRVVLAILISSPALAQVSAGQQTRSVDPLSFMSLMISIRHDDTEIGRATGFVVRKEAKNYLITNRHVVLLCSENKDFRNVGGWICAKQLSIFHNKLG